jgi:hypothetical protein
MITESFCVDLPKVMFKMMYRDYCEAHDIKIPDQNNEKANHHFDKAIDWIWEEYGDDVCAFLDGNLPEYFGDLEWDDSVEVTKAVAIMYIDYCADNPYFQIDLETYWKDLMRQAMDAQEFFFTPERDAEIWGEE